MTRTSADNGPRTQGDGRLTEEQLFSALPARSANREVKVGLFVIIGLAAFFVALFTLTDVGTFRGRYYATTHIEHAGGMRRGDPVQMRGVNIGRVSQFHMVPDGVEVRLELYNAYVVPADSRVVVRSSGLLGGMVVDVVPGTSPERAQEGDVLPGTIETGMMESAATVGMRADTVLARMTALLSQQTIGAVGESAMEMQALLAEMAAIAAGQREALATLTASLNRSASGLEGALAGGELERTVIRLDSMSMRLDAASGNLDRASGSLETVLARVEGGEGTLGQLSTNDSLYVNMNEAVTAIRELVTDIREEPGRYFNVRVF